MTNDIKISVLIPVRNAPRELAICIEGIKRSVAEYAASGGSADILVIDDASTDDTADVARRAGVEVMNLDGKARGPAFARNRGAEKRSHADVFVFVDSDVVLKADSLRKIAEVFKTRQDVDAMFGSYDDSPADPGFISQYKNLFHHYVHQTSMEISSSFWAGCGAIRASAFNTVGGFPESYSRPAIEDIELGYTLMSKGFKTILVKEIQVTHLKKWTFFGLVKTDILMRGIPWTVLLMKTRSFTKDLNLQTHNRVSVVLVYLIILAMALSGLWPWMWASVPPLLGFFIVLNFGLYQFFAEKRGFGFVLKAFPMHLLYYLYNGISFWLGVAAYKIQTRGGGDK